MAVTIKDIAKRAGVSDVTVSHALRGTGRMRDETRRIIQRLAREMHYRPRGEARAMRSGRLGSVALVMSADAVARSYIMGWTLKAITSELSKHNMSLTVSHLPDADLTDERYMPQVLREWMVDGLLINYSEEIPRGLQRIIDEFCIPAVWVNVRHECDCVHPDDFGAGCELTRKLIERGFRRIAFASFSHTERDSRTGHHSIRDRAEGYAAAMKSSGLSTEFAWLPEGKEERPERAVRHAAELLSRETVPEAFVTYSSRGTSALALQAARCGVEMPSDVALATFGETADFVNGIRIPTAISPQGALGGAAVRMFMEKLKDIQRPIPAQAVAYSYSGIDMEQELERTARTAQNPPTAT